MTRKNQKRANIAPFTWLFWKMSNVLVTEMQKKRMDRLVKEFGLKMIKTCLPAENAG